MEVRPVEARVEQGKENRRSDERKMPRTASKRLLIELAGG